MPNRVQSLTFTSFWILSDFLSLTPYDGFMNIYHCLVRAIKKNRLKRFHYPRSSRIDAETLVDCRTEIEDHVFTKKANLCGAFVGSGTIIGDSDLHNAKIGRFCSIGHKVEVVDATHPISLISTSPSFYDTVNLSVLHLGGTYSAKEFLKTPDGKYSCSIGNDVWIGNNVLIKGGVTIGDGSIIGMGTVVTKDVPPYSVFVGNPGRIVKYRFSPEVIEGLEESQWWLLSYEELISLSPAFENPVFFIAKIKELKIRETH